MLTKETLIDQVHIKTGKHSKADIERVLDAVFEEVAESLSAGDTVTLPGLGRLTVRTRKATKARNIQTGDIIDVPAQNVVRFSTSKQLKGKVNRKPEAARR